jgi:hypothetical protein
MVKIGKTSTRLSYLPVRLLLEGSKDTENYKRGHFDKEGEVLEVHLFVAG